MIHYQNFTIFSFVKKWSWRDSTHEKSCNSMQSVKIINYPQTTLNIAIKSNI